MKLAEYSGQGTVASKNLAPVDFGISDRPENQLMLLNILTNSLYSDKISAMWREYGCNAADANVEAGKADTAIEICLPTGIDPTATIRDSGLGLSPEFMMNGYTKLMESTKRDSNEMIGCLGIGRMSGLAYGDAFIVISRHKGVKTIYNIFRDKGMPRIAEMHSEPTKDPSGLEVKIPVLRIDINEFVTKAERVFRYFNVSPIVYGGKLNFQRGSRTFSGNDWHYIGDVVSGAIAIMGNVGYVINESSIHTLSNKQRSLLRLGVELKFGIGDLEITPNREGLQYKDQTINAIRERLDVMIKELGEAFTKRLAGAATFWDAKKAYGEAFIEEYGRRSLKEILDTNILWKGKKLESSWFDISNKEKDAEVRICVYALSWRKHPRKGENPDSILASDKTLLVINDLKNKIISPNRVREWFVNHGEIKAIVIFTFDNDAAKDRFWKNRSLEGAPTINFSSMPKAAPVIRTGTSNAFHNNKHSACVFSLKLDAPYYSVNSGYWATESIDYKNGAGAYVVINQFKTNPPNSGYHRDGEPSVLAAIINKLKESGILKGPLYGIREKLVPKLGKGWKLLHIYLKDELDKILAESNARQLLSDAIEAYTYRDLFKTQHKGLFPSGCLVWELLDNVERMRTPKHAKLFALIQSNKATPWLETPTNLPKPTIDLEKLEAKVKEKYPMLMNYPRLQCVVDKAALLTPVVQYVKLVEGAK